MKSIYDPVTVLAGVGPKTAENLAELGLITINDLLSYYPFRYEDIQAKDIEEIQDQEKVTLKGMVVAEPVVSHFGYKKNRLNFRIMQNSAVINVSFFNQSYLKDKVVLGTEIAIFGKWDAKRKSLTGMKILGSPADLENDFAPIYHVNKKIRQNTLIQLIHEGFDQYGEEIQEILPVYLTQHYHLIGKRQAMFAMHFPNTAEESHQARRQVIFEEFFLFHLRMQGLKYKEKNLSKGQSILYNVQKLKKFTQSLPFTLTDAQKKVTNEICRDLRSKQSMQRLLQGDVGSGKTVVAAIALYAVVTAGFQGALMVPTEILAEQHIESLNQLFDPLEVRIALLTSSTKAKARKQILNELAIGELDVIVGTHALIQEGVQFHRLGLVITDEQHRFGVDQRRSLREKGLDPDVLSMTATPIPRTLAITAFGEMDVSVIDELPKGRLPVETRWVRPAQLENILDWTRKELNKGDQIYVICPLIEESEMLDVKNATEIYQHLSEFYAPDFQVDLLHGKMKAAEKEQKMLAFKENKTQILVSTTVIEVGVNVPNATIMLIIDANRFGLAQLHQLRGRVGRGKKASHCILVADPRNEVGIERMKIMTETTDGFVLSEKDLQMRGPGEFFGARQSGVPQFQVGDLVRDLPILETARTEAILLWQKSNWWMLLENKALADYLIRHEQEEKYFD